jgi:hypothetical protein
MKLEYDKPLYVMAFDHRSSELARGLPGQRPRRASAARGIACVAEEHGDETLNLTLLSVRLPHRHALQQFLGHAHVASVQRYGEASASCPIAAARCSRSIG